jgi:phospholipase/carboxylesterase
LNPRQLVVFLHGYGADGANLIEIGEVWSELLPQAEFVSPNAPFRCEINPFGYQWFGLKDFSPFNIRAGLDQITPKVATYLKTLLSERSLSTADLALVGFSQGTMLALDLMFYLKGIQSVVGYSGAFYPPVAKQMEDPKPNVLLVHGDADMVVPFPAMAEAVRQLELFSISPYTEVCRGLGHGIDDQGLAAGGQFLFAKFQQSSSVIHMSS